VLRERVLGVMHGDEVCRGVVLASDEIGVVWVYSYWIKIFTDCNRAWYFLTAYRMCLVYVGAWWVWQCDGSGGCVTIKAVPLHRSAIAS